MVMLTRRRDLRAAALTTIMAWKPLTELEEVRDLLQLLGYRLEVRFGHLDAVRETHTDFDQLIEDERHLFMVDELPVACGTFLGRLQRVFAAPGYVIPTPGRS